MTGAAEPFMKRAWLYEWDLCVPHIGRARSLLGDGPADPLGVGGCAQEGVAALPDGVYMTSTPLARVMKVLTVIVMKG